MTIANIIDLCLAAIGEKYDAPEVKEVASAVAFRDASVAAARQNLVRIQKKSNGQSGFEAAPEPAGKGVARTVLPPKGSISASEFLAKLRDSGKTMKDGKPSFDASRIKVDQLFALSGFVGYSYSEPHGAQVDNAVRQARNILKPDNGASFKRGTVAPEKSYVKGTPDLVKRDATDLSQREVMLVERMTDNLRQSEKASEVFGFVKR